MKYVSISRWFSRPVGSQLVGLSFCVIFVGCSALSKEERNHIEFAARASAAAYKHASDGGAEAILIKTAYCEDQAVIRDTKLPAYDGGISCPIP